MKTLVNKDQILKDTVQPECSDVLNRLECLSSSRERASGRSAAPVAQAIYPCGSQFGPASGDEQPEWFEVEEVPLILCADNFVPASCFDGKDFMQVLGGSQFFGDTDKAAHGY